MKCSFCGGNVKTKEVTFVYENENKSFFVENVPAEVCQRCGEKTFSAEVTDELLDFAKKKSRPTKTIEVPVFDYGIHA